MSLGNAPGGHPQNPRGPDMELINAFVALYEALRPLTADKRLRLLRALCCLLDVPAFLSDGKGVDL